MPGASVFSIQAYRSYTRLFLPFSDYNSSSYTFEGGPFSSFLSLFSSFLVSELKGSLSMLYQQKWYIYDQNLLEAHIYPTCLNDGLHRFACNLDRKSPGSELGQPQPKSKIMYSFKF